MPVSSFHFLQGPLVAVAALAVIVLICRWVFSTDHRPERAGPPPSMDPAAADFGLLRVVAVVRSHDDATRAQRVLTASRIRSTLTGEHPEVGVLVFSADLARARELLRFLTTP